MYNASDQFEKEIWKISRAVAYALQNMHNLVISLCCFAEYSNERDVKLVFNAQAWPLFCLLAGDVAAVVALWWYYFELWTVSERIYALHAYSLLTHHSIFMIYWCSLNLHNILLFIF